MAWVWDQVLPTTKKMVLLAIADHADDTGDNAWPSVSTLARKVSITTRQVQRLLRELEDDGLLITSRQQGGTSRTAIDRRPNLYQIVMQPPDVSVTPGMTPMSPPPRRMRHPSPDADVALTIIEPSRNHPGRPKPAKAKDPIFDAVVQVCGISTSSLTKSSRGNINKAVKELKEVGASAIAIKGAALEFKKRYDKAQLTPSALVKHYPNLVPADQRDSKCQICDDPVDGHSHPKCSGCEGSGWTQVSDNVSSPANTVTRCNLCNGTGIDPYLKS